MEEDEARHFEGARADQLEGSVELEDRHLGRVGSLYGGEADESVGVGIYTWMG